MSKYYATDYEHIGPELGAVKVVIPGGSGLLGQAAARAFVSEGHEVVVLSRGRMAPVGRTVPWDGSHQGPWAGEVDGADLVLNLAGRSVNCRYTARNLDEMMASRIDSTRAVGEAIAAAARPPSVWLQMSTATIYAHRFDAPNDEATGIIGGAEPGVPAHWEYSVRIALRWEQTLAEADTPRTRKVAMRTAMVMSAQRGGVFDVLLGLVRRGMGGAAAGGRQFVSWIHESDWVRAVRHLYAHPTLSGEINVTSPNPLPYRDLMRATREAWGVGFGIPAARWMLEVGALMLGTESELILKSRRVIPGRLLDDGFGFEFPDWPAAAQDLVAQRGST